MRWLILQLPTIRSKGITDVLFLYNMDTFLTDNSISDVLASDSSDSSEE